VRRKDFPKNEKKEGEKERKSLNPLLKDSGREDLKSSCTGCPRAKAFRNEGGKKKGGRRRDSVCNLGWRQVRPTAQKEGQRNFRFNYQLWEERCERPKEGALPR